MQVKQLKSENLKREYQVTVPAKAIKDQVEARLKVIGKDAKMPGFRPGKIPADVLKKNYGPRVMGEVLDKLVQQTSGEALKKEGVRPALRPKIELIGGPGKEFWVDGKNYDLCRKMSVQYHPGAWRAEVSPTTAGPRHQFVTLLVPADVDQPAEPAASLDRRGGEIVVKQGRLAVTLDTAKQVVSVVT